VNARAHVCQVASGVLSLLALGSFITALAVVAIIIGG
jgi:hypothetical protein